MRVKHNLKTTKHLKNTVFYSWQSDLPNNSNRGFIETCIVKAIKELDTLGPFLIELNIDRDTKNEPGTPDITENIFKKIERAKIFIADISIINATYSGRKTPNPNVLIELGFAARALGWEKVICLYNTDFGTVEDLPFDLRQRRPILYSLKNFSKPIVRNTISKAIVASINGLNSLGLLSDLINEYLKVQVDTEILTIINHLRKIVWGYSEPNLFKVSNKFMNLTDFEIIESLKNSKFIGFQIFKRLEVNEINLRTIVDKVISSPHHGKEVATVLIDLIKWTGGFDKSNREIKNLFVATGQKEERYKAVSGLEFNPKNTDLPNRFILLKKIDEQHAVVEDFGDFLGKDKIEGLISHYILNSDFTNLYLSQIRKFIKIAETWLYLTNGEFIIDNSKMFKIETIPDIKIATSGAKP